MTSILNKFRRFHRSERGVVAVETLIMIPLLAWTIVAMAVYFDAFRTKSINLKAAYTISDMLSRASPDVDAAFIDGLKDTFDYLVESPNPTWVRTTLIQFDTEDPMDDTDGKYILMWSQGAEGKPKLTNVTLAHFKKWTPVMGDGDSMLIVETSMHYVPFYDLFSPYELYNVVMTPPRFTPPKWKT